MKDTINKNLYKIFIYCMKHITAILGLIQIICLILNYCGIKILALSCLGGTSFIFIGVLYIFSYVFKFCYLYRIPLYYITITTILTTIDALIGIPVNTIIIFRIHAIISGIFIILYIVYVYKNRNKPKVDYIKQLCERYNCLCK